MSLVGFKAQNHPQQRIRDDVDDRQVDATFFTEQHARHAFTVDAASSARNAVLPRFWTVAENALAQSWDAERVWCNPPYSDLEPWVEKAWTEMVDGGCELVVMLLPANRCEQGWWQRHVEFYRPPERPRPIKGDRPPFGCVLLTWSRSLSPADDGGAR